MAAQRAAKRAAVGVFAGLITMLLLAAGIAPTGRVGLYVLSALCVAAVCRRSGIREAILCVAAAILVALIVLPNKLIVLPFALFTAPHALLWCTVCARPRQVRWVCKGIMSVIFGLMLWWGLNWLAADWAWTPPIPNWSAGLLLAIALPVYDWVFSGAMRVILRYIDKIW